MAVKVIRAELAEEPGFRARFAREVAAAQKVSGLFTAQVVDADVAGTVPWLATAYVAGPSLAEAVELQGPLPLASVLTLAAGLAEGLGAIHAAGVVHRDLKPSNVLLATDGPRVIDFGVSRAVEASVLTQSGMVLGSPGFMSPEQAEGGEVAPSSDVFSLGAVLTFAATGEGPFGTGSTPALLYRVVHHQPDVSHVPEQVRPLVMRCLDKNPHARPTTAELLDELGGAQPAVDWLPAALAGILSRYAHPVTPGPGKPVVAGSGGPATATPAKRRRLWMPIIAVVMAAAALAAVFLPRAVEGSQAGLQAQAAPPRPASGNGSGRTIVVQPAAPVKVSQKFTGTVVGSKGGAPTVTISPSPSHVTTPVTQPTHTSPPPAPQPPQITSAQTYTNGIFVYFSIHYTDEDNDAVGFGFVGANGSGWAEEQHPFSSPSYGIVGSDSIDYPFNQACGTAQEYQSYVQAWIYDSEGISSQPVTLHLVCSS